MRPQAPEGREVITYPLTSEAKPCMISNDKAMRERSSAARPFRERPVGARAQESRGEYTPEPTAESFRK